MVQPGTPECDLTACFTTHSPPFRLGSHSHCGAERHCVAQRWSSVRLPQARSECRERRRHCGGGEGRRGMAGCSSPSLPPSLPPPPRLSSFCLSHLCYCRGLAYSPRLPFSCLVPLTLICQSCPAVPCHPRPPGRGGEKREECERVGRPPGDCARGPAERCKATLWFFLLSPPSFTFFFAIVAQNNRTGNREVQHVRLVSCEVKL